MSNLVQLKSVLREMVDTRLCVKSAATDVTLTEDMLDRARRAARELRRSANEAMVRGESGEYVVPGAAVAGGAGLTGASLGARKLFSKYLMPTSGRYADLADLTKATREFAATAGAANEAAPYLYAEKGHQASKSVPMTAGGARYITPGEAGQRARAAILTDIKGSKYIPKFLRNMLPSVSTTPEYATLSHYGAFSKSPLESYLKMVEEASTQGATQFNMGQLKHTLADIIADTPVSSWNEEFSRRLAPTSEYLAFKDKLLRGTQSARPADVSPFIRRVMNEAGIPLSHNLNAQQVRDILSSKGFFTAVHETDTPAALIRAHAANIAAKGGRSGSVGSLADVRFKPHAIQELVDPVMAANFRQAAATYGKYNKAVELLRRLGTRHAALAGVGVAGAGALTALSRLRRNAAQQKQAQARDRRSSVAPDALMAGGAATALPVGVHLRNLISKYGLKGLNPLDRPSVAVLGGVKDLAGVAPGTPMDSFSAQSNAVARELQNAGVNVEFLRGHTAGQVDKQLPYRISNPEALDDVLKRVSAVVQVGSHPAEYRLDRAMLDPKGVLRYRVLSDFGPGNLNQPRSWLNTLNWMGVHDQPKQYERFVVPGGAAFADMPKALGRKSNVNLAGIPVSELFSKGRFNVPQMVRGGPAEGFVTVGGGAMGFSLFDDVIDKLRSTPEATRYDYSKPNVLDDIIAAMRQKHGDQAKLKVLMGNLAGNVGLEELRDAIKADASGRWKGVDFLWDSVKQQELRDLYAKSHYTFAIPGSTSAEYMAMGGKPGKFVSLVPNERHWWMPKHFSTNAAYVEKNLPLASTLDIGQASPERVRRLVDALSKEAPAGADLGVRKGLVADFKPFVKALKRDIMLSRLGRLGRTGALAAIPAGLLGTGYALRRRNRSKDRG